MDESPSPSNVGADLSLKKKQNRLPDRTGRLAQLLLSEEWKDVTSPEEFRARLYSRYPDVLDENGMPPDLVRAYPENYVNPISPSSLQCSTRKLVMLMHRSTRFKSFENSDQKRLFNAYIWELVASNEAIRDCLVTDVPLNEVLTRFAYKLCPKTRKNPPDKMGKKKAEDRVLVMKNLISEVEKFTKTISTAESVLMCKNVDPSFVETSAYATAVRDRAMAESELDRTYELFRFNQTRVKDSLEKRKIRLDCMNSRYDNACRNLNIPRLPSDDWLCQSQPLNALAPTSLSSVAVTDASKTVRDSLPVQQEKRSTCGDKENRGIPVKMPKMVPNTVSKVIDEVEARQDVQTLRQEKRSTCGYKENCGIPVKMPKMVPNTVSKVIDEVEARQDVQPLRPRNGEKKHRITSVRPNIRRNASGKENISPMASGKSRRPSEKDHSHSSETTNDVSMRSECLSEALRDCIAGSDESAMAVSDIGCNSMESTLVGPFYQGMNSDSASRPSHSANVTNQHPQVPASLAFVPNAGNPAEMVGFMDNTGCVPPSISTVLSVCRQSVLPSCEPGTSGYIHQCDSSLCACMCPTAAATEEPTDRLLTGGDPYKLGDGFSYVLLQNIGTAQPSLGLGEPANSPFSAANGEETAIPGAPNASDRSDDVDFRARDNQMCTIAVQKTIATYVGKFWGPTSQKYGAASVIEHSTMTAWTQWTYLMMDYIHAARFRRNLEKSILLIVNRLYNRYESMTAVLRN